MATCVMLSWKKWRGNERGTGKKRRQREGKSRTMTGIEVARKKGRQKV